MFYSWLRYFQISRARLLEQCFGQFFLSIVSLTEFYWKICSIFLFFNDSLNILSIVLSEYAIRIIRKRYLSSRGRYIPLTISAPAHTFFSFWLHFYYPFLLFFPHSFHFIVHLISTNVDYWFTHQIFIMGLPLLLLLLVLAASIY